MESSINCEPRLTVSVTLTELGNKLCFESVKFPRLFIICKYLESLQSAGIHQTDANEPEYIYILVVEGASKQLLFKILFKPRRNYLSLIFDQDLSVLAWHVRYISLNKAKV